MADLRQIQIDQIRLARRPTRRFLGDVASLAASMQDYGLQQPVSVRAEGGTFLLTSGMRRLAAARVLKWTTIAAFVRSVTADEAYLIDLVENLQRQDLSPEEEADALVQLVRTRGWTLEQVAQAVKRSPGYVSKRVRVFEDPELRQAVVHRGLPVSSAELLLATTAARRSGLLDRAIAEQWDQLRVRDELQALESPAELSRPKAELPSASTRPGTATLVNRTFDGRASRRPPALTRIIREFYRTIVDIRAQDLTSADRSNLRALFKALVMLARSPTTPAPPVFPPLPSPRINRRKSAHP